MADALLRFEEALGFIPFKTLVIEDARRFKDMLDSTKNAKTGKPVSASWKVNFLSSVRAFIHWLADRPGYKARIRHTHADFFGPSLKDARIAKARRPIPAPTANQVMHAFRQMPSTTELDRRNKASFALMMLTGARIKAAASLRLGHIDLVEMCVWQDARDVATKFSKTFPTWFFPVDQVYYDCLTDWIAELRDKLLFGPTDPLCPRPKIQNIRLKGFVFTGLSRQPYAGDDSLRAIVKAAFVTAGLPPFTPHRFRNTLQSISNEFCKTPAEIKAWSMNIGHDSVNTTIDDYGRISTERQGEIIKGMRRRTE